MNKRIVGFVIIVVTLVSVGIWEFWGRETVAYKNILVLKEDLAAGTLLSENDFELKKVESPPSEALKGEDIKELINMQTAQYVAAGTELRREYFTESKFSIGKDTGKGLMSVSTDWLLSYPQTMRRGDKITFYNGTVKLMDGVVAHAKDSGGNEVTFDGENRLNSSGMISHFEVVGTINNLIDISNLANTGVKFTVVTERQG